MYTEKILLFSATISHIDYAAVCFVYILDYETQRFYEKQITIPIGRNVKMPENVLESLNFTNDHLSVSDVSYAQVKRICPLRLPTLIMKPLHADHIYSTSSKR